MTTLWFILGQDWFDCLLHTSFIKILNLRFKKDICRWISISSSYLVLVCPSLISNSYKGLCRARSIHSSAILPQLVCVLLCFYLLFVLVLGDWWRSWSWIGSRSKVTIVKRNRLFRKYKLCFDNSARSFYSHLDLLLIPHHPTFSDHTTS